VAIISPAGGGHKRFPVADLGERTRMATKASTPARSPFQRVIDALEAFYGRPKPPAVTDPFEQVLWENVAYLASDERRAQAWKRFKTEVGTKPAQILKAARSKLASIGKAGIVPSITADKLRKIAEIAVEEFDGDLKPVLKLPLAQAKKALRKFPSIGEPGAEKILLFSGSHPVLALDSNGLRVLLRLGFGRQDKSYNKSYRCAQEAVAPGLSTDAPWLTRAHQLLRRHGQELCKTNHPHCDACPLRNACAYASRQGKKGRLTTAVPASATAILTAKQVEQIRQRLRTERGGGR
jgi:endonuclease-3